MKALEELRVNIMANYKQAWNHHDAGAGCWCKPFEGTLYLAHRNYVWVDDGSRFGKWTAQREPGPAEGREMSKLPHCAWHRNYCGRACEDCVLALESAFEAKATPDPLAQAREAVVAAAREVARNFEKCPQNPHNTPTVSWRYLSPLGEALAALDALLEKEGKA